MLSFPLFCESFPLFCGLGWNKIWVTRCSLFPILDIWEKLCHLPWRRYLGSGKLEELVQDSSEKFGCPHHDMIEKSTRMMGSLNHRYSILAQLPCIASTCLLTFLTKSPFGSWAIYFRYSVPIRMRCSCYLGVQAEENFWFQRWRKLKRSAWTPTTTLGMFYSNPPDNIDQNTTLKSKQ